MGLTAFTFLGFSAMTSLKQPAPPARPSSSTSVPTTKWTPPRLDSTSAWPSRPASRRDPSRWPRRAAREPAASSSSRLRSLRRLRLSSPRSLRPSRRRLPPPRRLRLPPSPRLRPPPNLRPRLLPKRRLLLLRKPRLHPRRKLLQRRSKRSEFTPSVPDLSSTKMLTNFKGFHV